MALKKVTKLEKNTSMGSREANDAVRKQLASMGDDGRAIRHVLHYAYPTRSADRARRREMIAELTARDLMVSNAATRKGLVMEQFRSVAAATDFDAYTTALADWFAERGWEYDGWECAVAVHGARAIH